MLSDGLVDKETVARQRERSDGRSHNKRANGTAMHLGRTRLLEASPPQEVMSERAARSTASMRSSVAID